MPRLRATRLSAISQAVRQLGAFSPPLLFSSGEQGFWYDPNDLTTLFQDAPGTTPVTAVGQPVGLMLDKSRSASWVDVTGAVWTKTAGDGVVTVSGNQITITGATTATQVTRTAGDIPFVAGRARMLIRADYVAATGGMGQLRLGRATGAGAEYLTGDIPEIVGFPTVLAVADMHALERSQGAAFGITVA